VLTGCSEFPGAAQAHEARRDEKGPLSATLDEGGNAVYAPGVSPWHVSFGHFVLCSKAPGADIELEKVTLDDVRVRPLATTVLVRSVASSDFPKPGRTIPTRLQPFYSARGAAPDFTEPYADPAPAGRYTSRVAGTRVTRTCAETKERVGGYDELVFVFEVGDEGSRVDSFKIAYRAAGTSYTLRVPWNMVACGSAIPQRNICG
jgi:hypothetical protein